MSLSKPVISHRCEPTQVGIRSPFSLGDLVVLSGAIRELHEQYPGQFRTAVETGIPAIFAHNPLVTPWIKPDVLIDCGEVEVDRSGVLQQHYMAAYVRLFANKLGVPLELTRVAGDIYLSQAERGWFSEVYNFCNEDIPYWIICSGGKFDIPIKWWSHPRYQAVVDHFHGRINFVQTGAWGSHHPRLRNTVDLRGRTKVRDLIHLMHYAKGVVCGVTSLMHLAAAVPTENGNPRPAVIIAGAREPRAWEAYPDHDFIYTGDDLECAHCWKGPYGKETSDRNGCIQLADELPACMARITPDEVISWIEAILAKQQPVSVEHQAAAARAVLVSEAESAYDLHNITPENSVRQADLFISQIAPYPAGKYQGRGIIVCAGGLSYFTCAWVCISMLRRQGCSLPIEVWHWGEKELDVSMAALLATLQVRCVDASLLLDQHPCRNPLGWELKSYAMLRSRFEEILFLDADNVSVRNPEFLFDEPEYKKTGAVFWPDFQRLGPDRSIWKLTGVPYRDEPEFETGQMLIHKGRCWRALNLAWWYNDHSEFFYQHIHGDKETFHFAWRKMEQEYSMPPFPIHPLPGTMCQHDFSGNRLFQHRNLKKWRFFARNESVPGFYHEEECLEALAELKRVWNGRVRGERPSYSRGGFKFRVESQDEHIFESVFVNNEYDLPPRFKPHQVIVDIGAHIGSFSAACHLRGSRVIHAYEPDEENFELLRANLKQHAGVTVHHCAVLHQEGTVGSDPYPADSAGENTGGIRASLLPGGQIKGIPFDRLLREIGQASLVKLDCEGWEWPILMHSRELHRVDHICGEWHTVRNELSAEPFLYDENFLVEILRRNFEHVRCVPDTGRPVIGRFWASRHPWPQ